MYTTPALKVSKISKALFIGSFLLLQTHLKFKIYTETCCIYTHTEMWWQHTKEVNSCFPSAAFQMTLT